MVKSNLEGIVDISDPPKDFSGWDKLYNSKNTTLEEDVDNLKIYTSYYGNSRNLHNCITISISIGKPFMIDHYLPELEPTKELLNAYKGKLDKEGYSKRYKEEVLDKTSPSIIIGKIRRIMIKDGRRCAVLLCYEKAGDFCHRHLVSEWLRDAGYDIEEFPIHK